MADCHTHKSGRYADLPCSTARCERRRSVTLMRYISAGSFLVRCVWQIATLMRVADMPLSLSLIGEMCVADMPLSSPVSDVAIGEKRWTTHWVPERRQICDVVAG